MVSFLGQQPWSSNVQLRVVLLEDIDLSERTKHACMQISITLTGSFVLWE